MAIRALDGANNIPYSICYIAYLHHCSHDAIKRIFFDSSLWITNVWNQSWIISSSTFVPPFDDEPATQRHFPSEAVFFMSMTGQLLDAKLFFVSMILWCRVSQLACKHWQVWPPSMRSCAHPESDSDWCERWGKCSLYTDLRFVKKFTRLDIRAKGPKILHTKKTQIAIIFTQKATA